MAIITNTLTTLSPASISAAETNDYNPTGFSYSDVIYLSTSNAFPTLTSMQAGINGQVKTLVNISTSPFLLPGNDSSGTAANRFQFSGVVILYPGDSITLIYNGSISRWVKLYICLNQIKNFSVSRYYSAGSVTLGDIMNLTPYTSGGVVASTSAVSTYPGHMGLATSTSATAVTVASTPKTSGFGIRTGESTHVGIISANVSLSALSGATDTYSIFCGYSSSYSATAITANYAGFKYTHGTNSGKFQAATKNATTETTIDTGVTVAAETLYNLMVVFGPGNVYRFYINGNFVGKSITNYPVSGPYPARLDIVKTAGTTSRILRLFNISYLIYCK